jgi:hypothetical protein
MIYRPRTSINIFSLGKPYIWLTLKLGDRDSPIDPVWKNNFIFVHYKTVIA